MRGMSPASIFHVELAVLSAVTSEWQTPTELWERAGCGTQKSVAAACEYLWGRGLISACNSGLRGNLYAQAETCAACDQGDEGQTGEYPCEVCGLPLTHDEPEKATA